MIIFNSYKSHISLLFLNYYIKKNIIPVQLPPHTTHLLQPLDVGVFSPLQLRYSQLVDDALVKSDGLAVINKRRFYALFQQAYKLTMKSSTIISAWQKTGIVLMQPSIVLRQ